MGLIQKNNNSLTVPVVLLSPLDWGLGHTTRCIPIIKHLLSIGCQVIVAGNEQQQALLKREFNDVRFVFLQGYRLTYGRNNWQTVMKIVIQIPKIFYAVYYEKKWLQTFIRSNQIHAVISDNRYGFFTMQLPSIFITHQLTIKTPFGKTIEGMIRKINYHFIRKFSNCWIPDYDGENNLAGELSHPQRLPMPVDYLGRLSRLHEPVPEGIAGRLLIILSGPEPQRSIFEKILLQELKTFQKPVVLVRGLPKAGIDISTGNNQIVVHNYLPSPELANQIAQADIIISRSGYSTVMDIIGRNKKCIFIPTPGQSEQLYLADYLQSKQLCISFSQKNFSLEKALRKAHQFPFASATGLPAEEYKGVVEDFVWKLRSSMRDVV